MISHEGLANALLAAPLGVALLARLEWRATDAEMRGSAAPASIPDGVDAGVALVRTMSFVELVELALWALTTDVGPWIGDAPSSVASAYRDARARRPLAGAVAERFGDELHRPSDRRAQQWWTTAQFPTDTSRSTGGREAPRLGDFDQVYGAGQFTFGGLWTVTDPPSVLHESLVDVWEMHPGPVVRWHLPVYRDARVFEIHRPDDWVRLVTAHPTRARPGEECWELPHRARPPLPTGGDGGWSPFPAPFPDVADPVLPAELVDSPRQHAARPSIREHLVPDWASVARDWDGVHLSWAGLVTTEGFVSDLPDGDVAMLRYWFGERTLWLADVFGEPEPLGAVEVAPQVWDGELRPGAIDLLVDAAARERELRRLRRLLGR